MNDPLKGRVWRRQEFPRAELSGDLSAFVGKYVLVHCGVDAPVAWYVDKSNPASLELANGYRLHKSGKIRDEDNSWVGGKLISERPFLSPAAAWAWLAAALSARDTYKAAAREDAIRARTDALAHKVWRKDALERIAMAAKALSDEELRALDKSLTPKP